ncbi:ParA family protein [Staphylococcus simulans]|uniref:ParA family protein n=1 Tax=Staphylococcus simulans TaxID=1286 RepID=UPI000E68B755|nr:ParA family protein [Staphylococcus simulans]RIN52569.1 ParA family protein [Staphylococcus simulans]
MTRVITVNNFKGGVSKTSTTNAIAYILSQKLNYRTLVIDLDPQADATETLLLTFDGETDLTLYESLAEELNVENCLVKLDENLDLIPSDFNMIGFPNLLEDLGYDRFNGAKVINNFIAPIKGNYDIILIDTPPTISDYSSNAIYACDYSLIVMQTHTRSFRAVSSFIEYLALFRDNYQLEFEIAGILPVMFKNKGKIDNMIIQQSIDKYGEHIFKNYVSQRERVKLWDQTGITDLDYHDKITLKMYYDITLELLEQIKDYERE